MARHIVSLTDSQFTRAEKRAAARSARKLSAEARANEVEPERVRFPAPAGTRYGVRAGVGNYMTLWDVAQPANRATASHLAGIYPFVADEALGHNGPVLGVDLNSEVLFHYSPWDTYMDAGARGTFSTNVLVIGAYGAGKSGAVKTLVVRSLAFGHQAIVPSDSKGEWVVVADAIPGSQVIALGHRHSEHRLNPLDRGPRHRDTTDAQHDQMVWDRRRSTLQSVVEAILRDEAALTQVEIAALTWALRTSIEVTGDRPTLRHVSAVLGNATSGDQGYRPEYSTDAKRLLFALDRFISGDLAGLFDAESTVELNEDAPLVVVDTSALWGRGELAAQLTSICASAWIQAVISDKTAGRTRYVVREEGWRDMTTLSSLRTYQQWLKLSRDYGISNIVILHKLSDFDVVGPEGSEERALAYSIANDIENRFIFRQNPGEFRNLVERLRIPESHARLTHGLQPGVFLGHIGRGQYLVDVFATGTEWERELFNTDAAITAGMAGSAPLPIFPVFDDATIEQVWPARDNEGAMQ